MQNTRGLSDTVAHLGLRLQGIGQDRLASDPVVVRLGGQHRPAATTRLITSPPPAAPTGAASTVATHLPVVARSAALISRGVAAPRRRRAGTGGSETGDKVGKVAGMRVAVVPEPIAGTPMVVRRDGTTGTAPGGATCGHAESYAHPSGMPTPRW
jgi:hypothetical protein